MIVDHRLAAAVIVVVALLTVGLVALTADPGTGRPATSAPSTVADLSARVPAVVPASSTTLLPRSASSTALQSTSSPTTSSSVVATLPADADVTDLVRARRPAPDPTVVYVDDGAGHSDGAPEQTAPSEVASAVAVAIWSWRFDDPPDRLAQALTGLASPDVIAAATPSTTELDRRRSVGEVAWALAAPSPPSPAMVEPTELVIAVAAAQHVTTSMSAEVVVPRTATLRLHHGDAGWQVIDLVAAP